MSGDLFLGVDGGGTKTRFALMNAGHRLIGEAQLGTAYHPEVGIDSVREMLAEGLARVLSAAGVDASQLTHAFFGLPCHGEDSTITPVLDAMPGPLLGHTRYTVDNDMVCGWAGSLGAEDGINIVAGTGSIGYGQRGTRSARAGGWGEVFSDEGSAYWIAIQALSVFSRMSDGRLPKGVLYTLINQQLKLTQDLDLCAHVYGPNARTRGELAALSPLVTEAALQGDQAAREIFRRAAAELAQIAQALRANLGYEAAEVARLSYSGGAFKAGALLIEPFRVALGASFQLLTPKHEPHYGAALYAEKLARVSAR